MNYKFKKLRILFWNVRGCSDKDKCNVIRDVVRKSHCDILCAQETKWNQADSSYVSLICPSFFSREFVCLDAIQTRGGCFIGWKRFFEMENAMVTAHTCSVLLRDTRGVSVCNY